MREYNEIIDWYILHRNSTGVEDILRLMKMIPVGSEVLDIGCGDGIPVSKNLIDQGFTVYGIDSSCEMVKRFKANFPSVEVQCSDALTSDFFDMLFDATVAYGMVFHLPQTDQSRLIRKVSQHLKPGGAFLFNSGNKEGESISEMNGVSMKQYSMSAAQYNETLRDNRMILVQDYDDKKSGGYIYLAKKKKISYR